MGPGESDWNGANVNYSESAGPELTFAGSFSDSSESSGFAPPRPWFAVFVRSHHEKRISQHFEQRQIESFLPLYKEVHQWANRCKSTVELPLFPNYVFVRAGRVDRGRVLTVPGVLSIVCCGSRVASLPDVEIESLRSGLLLRKLEPHPYLVLGELVRIKAGPLKGVKGVLLRKKENLRVVITVAQIMQSVAVEVDSSDVEPFAG
jgi:transcription termination/antitermination protein NusG